jgi:ABC-type protease/lipase transport system fused ATPase/permease subunit
MWFVTVDGPSSALGADGELQLFESLIAARKGKTMVFVTRRFGRLTRYADKIMYVQSLKLFTCTALLGLTYGFLDVSKME